MAITATRPTASKPTASKPKASKISTGSTILTFENGVLNGGRILYGNQLLIGN